MHEEHKKRELISSFLYKLESYVDAKIAEVETNRDCSGTFYGCGAANAFEEMEEALYKLLDTNGN